MPYWMKMGANPTQFNQDSTSLPTIEDASSIIGFGAAGPRQISPVVLDGNFYTVNGNTVFNTTYATGRPASNMYYTDAETGAIVYPLKITFAQLVQVDVYDVDADNNEYKIGTFNMMLVQMDNGDIFIRPKNSDSSEWDDITQIRRMEVVGLDGPPTDDDAHIDRAAGFNAEIFDIEIMPCFAKGTMILTPSGYVAIETLHAGDLVHTKDHGFQEIRWIGSRIITALKSDLHANIRPIRIQKSALGENIPSKDLIVSPQHRILVRSRVAQKMFGSGEVLIAAKQLLQVNGIDIATDMDTVEYFHILFDQHEVIMSNGAETESLFTGPEAIKSLPKKAVEEIFSIFPELKEATYQPVSARLLPSGRQGRTLAVRHVTNNQPLVAVHSE